MSEDGEKNGLLPHNLNQLQQDHFPCWDEPEYKAIFSMTIITDEKYLRVSNEMVVEEEK